jgi:RNA polymerase sigma-70 factor, ECF subfamily
VEATLRLARARRAQVPYVMSVAERLLIGRLKQRDEQAFNDIVRLYRDKVFSLVYRMIGSRSEAEDIAQEVFVTVFKTIDSFRGESKFSTWLLRITANHSKNRIKYLARRPTDANGLDDAGDGIAGGHPAPPVQAHIDGPDVIMEAAELETLMQQAIADLEEDHRLLVVLRDVEELSYQEIAEITGLAEGTIKSRLHRARMAIKEWLDKNTK